MNDIDAGTEKITFTPEEGEERSTRVELWVDGKSVSRLWVIPYTLKIGAARVRMDGIGGVGTSDEHRNRGYARRMLQATVDWMAGRDAALTMLYGIANFYPKFGYATAGPDHLLNLPVLPGAPPPEGWQVRPFQAEDLPAVQRLYALNTENAVGAAVRPPEAGVWSQLLKTAEPNASDECRVVVRPAGGVAAYAWRGGHFWYIKDKLGPHHPNDLILAEVMADGPYSADAALTICRAWAEEESRRSGKEIGRILLAQPPEGPVANAARYRYASSAQIHALDADSMARVLNVERLFTALAPELEVRLNAASSSFRGRLHIQTDIGAVLLSITPDGIAVSEADAQPDGDALSVRLPQETLARLALGAFPPHDLLSRLPTPPDPDAVAMLTVMFPFRHPHMSIPDRY